MATIKESLTNKIRTDLTSRNYNWALVDGLLTDVTQLNLDMASAESRLDIVEDRLDETADTEFGSNANGTYVKHVNGVLECRMIKILSLGWAQLASGVWRSSITPDYDWPHVFDVTNGFPYVWAYVQMAETMGTGIRQVTANIVNMRFYASQSLATADRTIYIYAVGRWKPI